VSKSASTRPVAAGTLITVTPATSPVDARRAVSRLVLLLVLLEDRNCQKLAQASRNAADAQPVAAQALHPQNPRQSLSFSGGLDGLISLGRPFDPARRHSPIRPAYRGLPRLPRLRDGRPRTRWCYLWCSCAVGRRVQTLDGVELVAGRRPGRLGLRFLEDLLRPREQFPRVLPRSPRGPIDYAHRSSELPRHTPRNRLVRTHGAHEAGNGGLREVRWGTPVSGGELRATDRRWSWGWHWNRRNRRSC
jgi:hypothetical protein